MTLNYLQLLVALQLKKQHNLQHDCSFAKITRTDVHIAGTPRCFVMMRRHSLCNCHKMSTLTAAQKGGTPFYRTTHFCPMFLDYFCLVALVPVLKMVAV
jgi:hypothetical protein